MLIIIKHDFITAGTKCFLEHICKLFTKSHRRHRGIPLMTKCFTTSFAIVGGIPSVAQLPQGRPCVCGVGAMAPARTQPPIPVLVQSTALISKAAHLLMALEEQVENRKAKALESDSPGFQTQCDRTTSCVEVEHVLQIPGASIYK